MPTENDWKTEAKSLLTYLDDIKDRMEGYIYRLETALRENDKDTFIQINEAMNE